VNIKKRSSRVLKFLVAGGSAALIEYVIFLVLNVVLEGRNIAVSQSVSYICGFIVSFILNKFWVFASKGSVRAELVRYALLAVINLGLSNLVIVLLTNELAVKPAIAKLIVMGMVAAWNYVIFQNLIFRSEPDN
jgi:putative flippase GtrA